MLRSGWDVDVLRKLLASMAARLTLQNLPVVEESERRLAIWHDAESANSSRARLRWAAYSAAYERYDEAVRACNEAITSHGATIEALHLLGLAFAAKGQAKRAIGAWIDALPLPTHESRCLAEIAHDLVALQEYPLAAQFVARAHREGALSLQDTAVLAEDMIAHRFHADALPLLRDLDRDLPDSASIKAALGYVLISLARYPDAVRVLEQALRLDRADPEKWGLLATAYNSIADHAAAVRAFESALDLDPAFLDRREAERAIWEAACRNQVAAQHGQAQVRIVLELG